MDALINLLILVVLFFVLVYLIYWVCTRFKMPDPVFWLVGAILLIMILVFVSGHSGVPVIYHR